MKFVTKPARAASNEEEIASDFEYTLNYDIAKARPIAQT